MDSEDLDKSLNSSFLEEVFNEVESSEKIDSSKIKSLGFLEDVVKLETQLVLNKKKSNNIRPNSNSRDYGYVKSLVHEGFTDSSDDEENKYFEQNRYNECGKNLKTLLAMKDVSVKKLSNLEGKKENVKLVKEKLLEKLKGESESKNKNLGSFERKLLIDPILHMRIINPLVSSETLKEKMNGRTSVSISKIKQFLNNLNSKNIDWVTGGVITSKASRISKNGNHYCMWSLTDLQGDIKSICVLLFNSAYQELWKTPVGTIVGLLNPDVLESKERLEATLKISNSYKVLIMGTSKDYGICKSKKKNGENCTAVVNVAKCEICTYHLKSEYKKACRRSDLQPPKIGRSLDNLKTKLSGKNQVSIGKKVFIGICGKKNPEKVEKDKLRLQALGQTHQPLGSIPNVIENNQCQTKYITNKIKETKKKENKESFLQSQNNVIDLDFTITKKDRNLAKAKALNYVRIHGPIKKIQDNCRLKKTPEQINLLKRKLEVGEDQENKKLKKEDNLSVTDSKNKLERCGITEKFLQMMNAESKNMDLVNIGRNEEQEKYFNKLEIREKMEDKMAATFKVDCKAVRCLKCNYKSFSAAELCKKEKHPIKVFNAVKRFWKCGDCSARTVSLELVPLHSCKTCGSSKWERSSMMPEKKNSNILVEPLSLRGMEEKFLGSTIKNANLNLLVPEESL